MKRAAEEVVQPTSKRGSAIQSITGDNDIDFSWISRSDFIKYFKQLESTMSVLVRNGHPSTWSRIKDSFEKIEDVRLDDYFMDFLLQEFPHFYLLEWKALPPVGSPSQLCIDFNPDTPCADGAKALSQTFMTSRIDHFRS